MADFNTALQPVLDWEGGWVNNPADTGGQTYAGISQKNWPQWAGWAIVNAMVKQYPNLNDLNQALESSATLAGQVQDFYHTNFWKYDTIESQLVANKLLSLDVLTNQVARLAQQSLLELGVNMVVDGRWGPKTQDAINAQKEADMMHMLRTFASLKFAEIVISNNGQHAFLKGWLKRATY
jgi:lysozyme family protein